MMTAESWFERTAYVEPPAVEAQEDVGGPSSRVAGSWMEAIRDAVASARYGGAWVVGRAARALENRRVRWSAEAEAELRARADRWDREVRRLLETAPPDERDGVLGSLAYPASALVSDLVARFASRFGTFELYTLDDFLAELCEEPSRRR